MAAICADQPVKSTKNTAAALPHGRHDKKARNRTTVSCGREQKWNIEQTSNDRRGVPMVRIARESLALVSVASFVWMMCQVAQWVA
jgi:hypothetical protein